jgi:carboxymethylenebutenolidase
MREWWGLDDQIRSVYDRLASGGLFALAPDLYRQEPDDPADEAQQRMMALSIDRAEKDMIVAVEHLVALHGVEGEHVGALGFCLGGGLAVWAAAATPPVGTTVSCYG